jgi:hypothetical protein
MSMVIREKTREPAHVVVLFSCCTNVLQFRHEFIGIAMAD